MHTDKTGQPTEPSTADWTRSPLSLAFWWVIPIVAGNLGDHLALSQPGAALAWSAALAWMGLGCVLNARRCHRRHCYISGPIMLVGAIVVSLVGWNLLPLGPNGISLTLWTTFGLVLLSFLAEAIWGRYARS